MVRNVPRAVRVNDRNYRPRRTRYPQESVITIDDLVVAEEVPFYAATPAARTVKDLMRNKMDLKSGFTGFSVPHGSTGAVVYPPTEVEADLLFSMGPGAGGAGVAIGGSGAEPLLGHWMTEILLQ